MYNRIWSRKELTRNKLGRFGEYYAKMALASYGLSIYTSEVDDHGIDFVAETSKGFLKFQVKTVRDHNPVYFEKEKFYIDDDSFYIIFLSLTDNKDPDVYIIPASEWKSHNYKALKCYEKEYCMSPGKSNLAQIDDFKVENMIDTFV